GLQRFFRPRPENEQASDPPHHTERVTSNGDIARAAAEMAKTESEMSPPPALTLLGQRLGLSRFDQQVILLCAASELDTRIPGLCARANGDPNRPWPTFALCLGLFENPAWDVLSPERPIRYLRLIEIFQHGSQPLTTSPLR